MSKRKVLFVDDEANILSGLKRMLRSMRREFEMFFAESGVQALELLDEHHFEVVISDMRMPGMDGASLLAEVKKRSPSTVRIILSGEADVESICRTVGVTHQFLSKPCDGKILGGIIRRACTLHEILADETIKSIVSAIDVLPSLPEVYNEMQQALQQPEVTTEEIGSIITRDIAMTAKILQLVNSSFFGLRQKVETPVRAVQMLGIETVKVLVIGLRIFEELHFTNERYPPEILWKHSLTVANCARRIAIERGAEQELVGDAFIGGMLHDIGKLILMSRFNEKYVEAQIMAETEKIPSVQAEKASFGVTQNELGAYLVGLWGFSSGILESIAFQGRLDELKPDGFCAAVAVHTANCFYYTKFPEEAVGTSPALAIKSLAEAGLDGELKSWEEICFEYMEEQVDTE